MPSATTNEIWSFNGVVLNTPYWNISTMGGSRFDLPQLRGSNYAVAYRAGQQWRAKQPDQRKILTPITLAMWAAGIDSSTGQAAQDQKFSFNSNFQALRSLFWTSGNYGSALGTLVRNWNFSQNGANVLVQGTAMAEIAGTMTPSMTGRTRADFAVDLLLADPFFYGVQQAQTLAYNTVTNVINLGEGAIGFGQPSGLGGVPFTVKLTGPLTTRR